jgi:tetratricopeptide (TPR) repeat protein
MTMRHLLSQFALVMLLLMLATGIAPQAGQKQQDSPDQSGAQKGQNQKDQDQKDQPDQPGAPSQKNQGDNSAPKPPEQKPPDDKDLSGWSSSSSSSTGDVKGPPQELPKYNPLPAEQDVDVGTYYMRKGDLDAAISRFEDAIQLKSDYARPRMLLAQLYEKKGNKTAAVKYYKEYLEVYPHAPDAKKVQAKIEKLTAR